MWTSLALLAGAIGMWRRSLTSKWAARAVSAVVLTQLLLLVAYATINRLTGSGIDASVLYHLRVGFDGAGLGAFAGTLTAAAALVVASLVVATVSFRLLRAVDPKSPSVARLLAGLALMAGAIWFNPGAGDLAQLAANARLTGTRMSGPPPPHFVPVERLEFPDAPRNFVLLYLESVERSYLDEARFPGLMPNLSALEARAISFTDISEVSGSGWTIAGMVASQCGMPLIGSGAGLDAFLPGATCIGDLLDPQGFDLTYLGGADLAFAGKGAFYDSHGFDRVVGRAELQPLLDDPDYVNDWGLFDDSLYAEATRRFDALAGADAPFGLVLLTLDTHHPFGFTSRSCADQPYSTGENEFLNAVHCADRLAAEFIRYVIESPAFKDTVLIVASDHLAMPNLAQDRLEAGDRSNLLMVFAPDLPPATIPKPGTTLDIGPMLLGLIGAPTPALGFGRDLLANAPTLRGGAPGLEELIGDSRGYLATLWAFPQLADGIISDPEAGEVILGRRRLKPPALLRLNAALEVTAIDFDLAGGITLTELVASLPDDQRFVWMDACRKTAVFAAAPPPEAAELCALAGTLASPDLRQIPLFGGIPVEAEALGEAFARGPDQLAFHDALLTDRKRRRRFATANVIDYTPPNGLTGEVAIRSAGYSTGDSWALNLATGERVKLMRGLTLLGLSPNEAPIKIGHVDTCGYGGRQSDGVPLETGFQAAIDANAGVFGAFAIVAHNSVVCYEVEPGLEPLFEGTGLTKWRDLWYEQPYIALIAGNGETKEFVGARQTALGLDLQNFMRPVQQDQQRLLSSLPRIAHSGGALDGRTYTNSLEALNANADAFDLIEIDLTWTSDRELVCLHDWDQPFLALDGVLPANPLSLAEVQDRTAAKAGFRPCTLASLAGWMRANGGVRIVLDLKAGAVEAYRKIAETYPDLGSRFVPQIYQPEDYRAVRDMGYGDVIWSLYQYGGGTLDVLAWLQRMDLLGLAMPPERLSTGLARQAREATGVLSWVHTLNTLAEFDAALQAGAAEIFTDSLPPPVVARFEVISSGHASGESTLRPLDGGAAVRLTRGVNLVALAQDGSPELLTTFDGCAALDTGKAPDPAPFRKALTEAAARGQDLAVVVHDSAFCEGVTLAPLFAGSPLVAAPKIEFRQPYIGQIRADGRVLEFSGAPESSLRETIFVEVAP
ncbi:MAG: hypothetical protein C0524_11990 [Rhodobacter sp.]|nr:hypothetical protein [Rhodobacter sp.]